MNNNTTKRFPGNRSKKISKNVIIITERDFPKEEGSGRGKKGATRDKTFSTKEVKKESFKRAFKREREFKAHLDDDGGLDGLHSCIEGKRLTRKRSSLRLKK